MSNNTKSPSVIGPLVFVVGIVVLLAFGVAKFNHRPIGHRAIVLYKVKWSDYTAPDITYTVAGQETTISARQLGMGPYEWNGPTFGGIVAVSGQTYRVRATSIQGGSGVISCEILLN